MQAGFRDDAATVQDPASTGTPGETTLETTLEGESPTELPNARARTPRARRAVLDPVLAAAVDLARAVAEELAADTPTAQGVGEHLGVTVEGERLVAHEFACLLPGYLGWRWSVVLARAPRQKNATVVESALLPGPGALLAPEWLPWSERLQPGDLGVGDVLPTDADDPRLAPGWTGGPTPADGDAAEFWELGFGRVRVLSLEGRTDAAERWYAGDGGPAAPIAQAAPAPCASCGFLVLLGGSFRQAFGVCSNLYSPSDGTVVSLDHGCGAHSEAATAAPMADVAPPVLDDLGYDFVSRPEGAHPDGSVDSASPGEELGHS